MKRVLLIALLMLLTAANPPQGIRIVSNPRPKCHGYSIIEFGRGIDCKGDTVKLVHAAGFQALAKVNDNVR